MTGKPGEFRRWLEGMRALVCKKLPTLTDEQVDVVVDLIRQAHVIGGWNEFAGQLDKESEVIRERSKKGVEARRRKSRRSDIAQAFTAAASKGKDVSIEQLAKEYGVSRATAYRALSARPAGKRRG